MRPSSADTSEPAWVKRKMLSTKNSTSWPWSRKYSGTVRPDRPTRAREPGGSLVLTARTRPRGLVHLAEPQRALRAGGGALLGVLVDARLDHLVIEVVALARPFAD